jgi:hypothetical protein
MKKLSLLISLMFIMSCATLMPPEKPPKVYPYKARTIRLYKKIDAYINKTRQDRIVQLIPQYSLIDSMAYIDEKELLELYMNRAFSFKPYRENEVTWIKSQIRREAGRRYKNMTVRIYSNGYELSELVPNYYRSDRDLYDLSRMAPEKDPFAIPLLRFPDHPVQATAGLYGSHLALLHSHGWYYENSLDRWEWQRARVFQIVEDLYPMSYTVPFLAPMLENAGATVLFPRERDIQSCEVIVDADSSTGNSRIFHSGHVFRGHSPGFSIGDPPYGSGVNPFKTGSWQWMNSDTSGGDTLYSIPDIPESGEYAVYLSWADTSEAITDAEYLIRHTGGIKRVLVNQTIGFGTWIYAGTYPFSKGADSPRGSVALTSKSKSHGKVISADAVRFGGGMGNVSRNGRISKRPRFTEGARYYLQYAGFPDTLVYNLNADTLDYNDDYQCRGAWVNYMAGSYSDSAKKEIKGLGIPVDLSLSFHTDAGSARTDTVIGTLMIYSSQGYKDTLQFPNGVNRIANRDFADILQTQITDDLLSAFDPVWNRRGLWDRKYNESWKPTVPAGLLELLSHHNFLDMKFGLDPRFRFFTSRSIYKGILKFLATYHDRPYVVQPLPPVDFSIQFDKNRLKLKWDDQHDPLERTAVPDYYLVYMKKNGEAFRKPILCPDEGYITPDLEKNTLYSFHITAVNAGGESFPSVTLSAGLADGPDTALVVYHFDRVSAPETLEQDPILGFADFLDQGVPWGYDLSYVGSQYEYNGNKKWVDDDNPGHGASFADYETQIIAGNTFDYAAIHGEALLNHGISFTSCQVRVLEDTLFSIKPYSLVDVLAGEQKTTYGVKPFQSPEFRVWTLGLKRILTEHARNHGLILVSGAYIGTDAVFRPEDKQFCEDVLKFRWRTNNASRSGEIYSVLERKEDPVTFTYVSELNDSMYAVESPDGIEPVQGSTAETLFRYPDNNISAGTFYKGDYSVVALGIPFETVRTPGERNALLGYILSLIKTEKGKTDESDSDEL